MQQVEAEGVTVAEWAVLREMLELGPVSPSHLAERLGMSRGAISKLVERLFQKQLVERSSSVEDRRSQSVAITSRGKKLVPRLARLADANDQKFFGHLSVQSRTNLIDLLKDMVQQHGWKDVPIS